MIDKSKFLDINKLKISCSYDIRFGYPVFYLSYKDANNDVYIFDGDANEWIKHIPGTMYINPSFVLSEVNTQLLLNDLAHAGFSTPEGKGINSALVATENHLADMRALVFKSKPKEFKE